MYIFILTLSLLGMEQQNAELAAAIDHNQWEEAKRLVTKGAELHRAIPSKQTTDPALLGALLHPKADYLMPLFKHYDATLAIGNDTTLLHELCIKAIQKVHEFFRNELSSPKDLLIISSRGIRIIDSLRYICGIWPELLDVQNGENLKPYEVCVRQDGIQFNLFSPEMIELINNYREWRKKVFENKENLAHL